MKQIVLASRPKGAPEASNFRQEEFKLNPLQSGEVHLKGKYFSVDPYMRGRMNDTKSYIAPFELDKPISGGVVAEVLESKSEDFEAGDLVQSRLPWQEESIVAGDKLQKIDTEVAPATYYLSILGLTGLTAYFGLLKIGEPKKGETIVVSGAAGAVGLAVGQIGKLKGCRVVGIAGSDAKIDLITSKYGYDAAINYKTTDDMAGTIGKACPDGVDIYFDNVGGEISDAVISKINFHARIPLCGQIALYNSKEQPTGPRLQPKLLTRSVKMQGFIVSNYKDQFEDGIKELGKWVKSGDLKFEETIVEGFDKLPDTFLGLFSGDNIGKMLVKA